MSWTFYVQAVRACPTCNGSGYVSNPAWAGLSDEQFAAMSHQELALYFGRLGYSSIPAEEIICNTCYGSGEEEQQMSLSEALEFLKEVES